MKARVFLTKRDVAVALGCIVFVLANLGAVGSSGRRRAKEMVCFSNLVNWGRLWKSYTDDHNGRFPTRGGGSVWGDETIGAWPYTIWCHAPAVSPKMRFCPEATRPYIEGGQPPFAAWDQETEYGDPAVVYASYTINYWLANEPDPQFWGTPHIRGAGHVPLMSDGNWKDAEPYPDDEPPEYEGYWWQPNANEMKRVCVNRHRGGVNVVFVDFSVRKVGLKELWRLWWYRDWPADPPLPNPSWPGGDWPEWMHNFKDY